MQLMTIWPFIHENMNENTYQMLDKVKKWENWTKKSKKMGFIEALINAKKHIWHILETQKLDFV